MPITLDASSPSFVTLDEVKAHANVSTGGHDFELDLFRGAAQEAVEGIIGPVLHRNVTETVRVRGGSAYLSTTPVVALATVDGAATLATVNTTTGLVSGLSTRNGTAVIAYTAGRTTVPDSVRVATLIIAEHLWQTQRGSAPSPFQGDDGAPSPGLGYSIPNRAVDLLRPYMLPPAVG